MTIIRYYRTPALSAHRGKEILTKLKEINNNVETLSTEFCYHIELAENAKLMDDQQTLILKWILSSPLYPEQLQNESFFLNLKQNQGIIECGPRFNFSTADSSNSVQICQSVGLKNIIRLEVSKRYFITLKKEETFSKDVSEHLSRILFDRMTECVYTRENLPRASFNEGLPKDLEKWFFVPLLKQGKKAMHDVNKKLGLAFDDWDIDFYSDLFMNKLKRNPTSVECFDLAQSNSEHSRHWFFKGKIILDGVEYEESLIDMIMDTQKTSNKNNVIKFGDNSSAIRGFTHRKMTPSSVTSASKMNMETVDSDLIFTAETHNMPTGVAPFSGATTGTGGRIRDVQAVGRGGHTIAGTAGYCVGNLKMPGYDLPWEDDDWVYPENFASPLEIIIEASNGASDYGNKFGEPVITGFVQSYGLKNGAGVREEFVKPIMFSGGIGYMPDNMVTKMKPSKGMLVVKLGGPVYRIGVGGGAASSVAVQGDGDRAAALDFGAVQRGDAQMGNRLNRVVRACLEASENPVLAIHDQGAGGNGNVLKELVEPEGAIVFTKEFNLGDPTITVMELWGAEYQENNAVLCKKDQRKLLEDICNRERCPVSFVGEVTGDGCMRLVEDSMDNIDKYKSGKKNDDSLPFNLDLEAVLGNMPRKKFMLTNTPVPVKSLVFPPKTNMQTALDRVLRLVSVGSKRFLTNKVDRCVTGLIAQQQCVGPLHTPLADFGIIALSHSDISGAATSIGTQTLKGFVDPEIGARMTVGEALTNLVFAGITCLEDVKCSGNWMWSGKTGDTGGKLAVACRAMCDIMKQLGIAVDGGKDSLSMAAGVKGEKVNSPGTLVVSTYAPCPDIRVKVEPYLKETGSILLWVPISSGKYRLGGSALAQCYKQQGKHAPDVDDPISLLNAFNITQKLIKEKQILSGHDISDGGIITCILEMAFAGLRGLEIDMNIPDVDYLHALFNEELGLILEVNPECSDHCIESYKSRGLTCRPIGKTVGTGMTAPISVVFNDSLLLSCDVYSLLRTWEETSYRLELLQANSECVQQEWDGLKSRTGPVYKVTFDSEFVLKKISNPIRVAVIREEGTNGDREMIASLMKAEFDVYDVTMQDLLIESISLDMFKGVVFPGGFSYADTLGSAKGWAATILFNSKLRAQFNHFALNRRDTFSLGVCNGCQLMALLGWIEPESKPQNVEENAKIVLEYNKSERFECRWSCVSITQGMGNNVWLSGMEGSRLGIWVAHGEGRFTFHNSRILQTLQDQNQICMQYVDDRGNPTEEYPMNPNGSPCGIAGICSVDGRHLAMMPHPERCTLTWQCPYMLSGNKSNKENINSPWQKLFANAYIWASRQ